MISFRFVFMPKQKVIPLKRVTVQRVRTNRPTYKRAMDLLRAELAHLGVQQEVVVEAGHRPEQIRNDGFPRGSSTPEHGQVRISFTDKHGRELSFMQTGWTDFDYNLYTIAMLLKYLRDADVYACDASGAQYRGYAQLPPGGGSGHGGAITASEWPSMDAAERWLREYAAAGNLELTIEDVYRAAAKRAHPDTGGSQVIMAKVNRCRDFLQGAKQ